MAATEPLVETFEQMAQQQLPNLYRLYLNPYVVQMCLCLEQYIHRTWPTKRGLRHQTFVANSFDEALAGAIKLARHHATHRATLHC